MYSEQIKNMITVVNNEENEENGEYEAIWILVNNGRVVIKIGVIFIYKPQEGKATVKKMKEIYKKIEKEVEKSILKSESIILMGDFNCKIGIDEKGNDGEVSKGGKILMEMVKKHDLLVVNKEEKCEGTWTRILGNEKSALDFMIIKNEDSGYLQSMSVDEGKLITPLHVTPDAERRKIYSDHCMLTTVINWRLKLQGEKTHKYMGEKAWSR